MYVCLFHNISDSVNPMIVRVLRIARIARIMRLIKSARGLSTLLKTLYLCLPSLLNVAALLGLIFLIYAVLGMALFGKVAETDDLNRHAHMSSFWPSVLLLMRMSTGEAWNSIMHSCMQDSNITGCVVDNSIVPTLENNCGSKGWAVIYFISFQLIGSFVLLNLVIGVILDNFSNMSNQQELQFNKEHISQFTSLWGEYDRDASYYIPSHRLPDLLLRLPPPLGLPKSQRTRGAVFKLITELDIPDRGDKIHFQETLYTLTSRCAGVDLPECEITSAVQKLWASIPNVKKVADNNFEATISELHAAVKLQSSWRGEKTRREALEKQRERRERELVEISENIAQNIIQMVPQNQ